MCSETRSGRHSASGCGRPTSSRRRGITIARSAEGRSLALFEAAAHAALDVADMLRHDRVGSLSIALPDRVEDLSVVVAVLKTVARARGHVERCGDTGRQVG